MGMKSVLIVSLSHKDSTDDEVREDRASQAQHDSRIVEHLATHCLVEPLRLLRPFGGFDCWLPVDRTTVVIKGPMLRIPIDWCSWIEIGTHCEVPA
jgi:hypothetical protein